MNHELKHKTYRFIRQTKLLSFATSITSRLNDVKRDKDKKITASTRKGEHLKSRTMAHRYFHKSAKKHSVAFC